MHGRGDLRGTLRPQQQVDVVAGGLVAEHIDRVPPLRLPKPLQVRTPIPFELQQELAVVTAETAGPDYVLENTTK